MNFESRQHHKYQQTNGSKRKVLYRKIKKTKSNVIQKERVIKPNQN